MYTNSWLALVKGFVNLPTVMLTDSAEVLWELVNFAREVQLYLIIVWSIAGNS